MKKAITFVVAILAMNFSFAQEQTKKKTETVVIQTKSNCKEDACEEYKEIIENTANYIKGVVFAEFDSATRKVTIKYKTKAVTAQQIRQKIADAGYDADDVKATKESTEKLPGCCKSSK